MPAIRRLSIVQQTVLHLRDAMRSGRWQEGLPGVRRLAVELGVSRDTARAAVKLLEAEGQLQPQGHGRRRQVVDSVKRRRRSQRIGVLLHVPMSEQNAEMQRTLTELQHDIELAGHIWIVANKTQGELGDDSHRLSRLVKATHADSWILVAPSRSVQAWFSEQSLPAITFGGASTEFAIAGAGVDAVPPIREAVRHLTKLGHKRIVLISPPQWREPAPSRSMEAYFDELRANGITPSDYHAPNWELSPEGLHRLLESLFQVTPPTVLLVVEPPRVLATLHFLNHRRLRVPEDISLVCLGQDPMFHWCYPPIAHLHYDLRLPARRIAKWVASPGRENADRRFVLFPAEFDPAGSIGPAR